MKKYELFKILGITFLIGVLLTWIVPIGSFQTGNEFVNGGTAPLGFLDLFRIPLNTLANFIQYGMLILAIGGLYGILNKTSAYSKVVETIVVKFQDKPQRFVIISLLSFVLLSSFVGLNTLFLVLVPFFATIILLLGYSKLMALLVTIGAMLVGTLTGVYNDLINTSFVYFWSLSPHNEIITKIVFLIIVVSVFVFFVLERLKKTEINKNDGNVKIPLYKKNIKENVRVYPLVIISIFTFVLLSVGMYNWFYGFGIELFNNVYEAIMSIKINNYPLVANIIGQSNPLGLWTIYDLILLLIILSVTLAWVYSLEIKEAIKGYLDGAKELIPVAFYVVLANILIALIFTGQGLENIFSSISYFILTITDKFNILTMSLTSIIGSIFYNDFNYYAEVMGEQINVLYNNELLLPSISLILQFMHGLVMFVAPTSILLIAGLSYFEISYLEWLKYIWKLVLKLFVVSLAVVAIVAMFI